MFGLGLGLALGGNAGNWPSWRGDLAGSGLAKGETIPLTWDMKKNVRWRVPLPDRGNSTPIVWGDKVFLTTAIAEAGQAKLKAGLYGNIGAACLASPAISTGRLSIRTREQLVCVGEK